MKSSNIEILVFYSPITLSVLRANTPLTRTHSICDFPEYSEIKFHAVIFTRNP